MEVKSETIGNNEVPMFLLKLVDLLKAEEFQKYVSWAEAGTSFCIKDHESFSKIVLPKYFKHNKFQSFVRQLNLYGFRKVASINHGLYKKQEIDEFRHPFFIKNKENLLPLIKRKVSLGNKYSEDITQLLDDIHEIKNDQIKISNSLLALKDENSNLWSEVVSLRQKHAQQQKIVNHLVKFLVSLVQHHGMGRKRRLPIAWKDDDTNFSPQNKVAKPTDNLEIFDEFSDLIQDSPNGPLITELFSSNTTPDLTVVHDDTESADPQSHSNETRIDFSDFIDNLAQPDNAAVTASENPVPLTKNSELQLVESNAEPSSSYLKNPKSLLSLFDTTDSQPLSDVTVSSVIPISSQSLPTDTISSEIPISIISNPSMVSTTRAKTSVLEPNIFFNTTNSIPVCNTKAVSDNSESNSLTVVQHPGKIRRKSLTPIYTKKANLQQALDKNIKKVDDNIQNIHQRLSENDQFQLDYEMLQDLFNGQVVLPHPDGSSDPKSSVISLSQPDGLELSQYTDAADNAQLSNINLCTDTNNNAEELDDLTRLLD